MHAERILRDLTYAQAVHEGLHQAMEVDPRVILVGECLTPRQSLEPQLSCVSVLGRSGFLTCHCRNTA
jgi:hypothetical protein